MESQTKAEVLFQPLFRGCRKALPSLRLTQTASSTPKTFHRNKLHSTTNFIMSVDVHCVHCA
ncbi:hypothetical protein J6590_054338 [Homalodisca vitripennis]|nr:hypothetical protein J6590_054338 [Homalodisca vitripennis]